MNSRMFGFWNGVMRRLSGPTMAVVSKLPGVKSCNSKMLYHFSDPCLYLSLGVY